MKESRLGIMAGLLVVNVAAAGWWSPAVRPARLRCEYLENPPGIDVIQPRLSWVVEVGHSKRENGDLKDPPRGVKQTAYRVLVASSEKLLAQGRGDLWDSGKVAGGQNIVEYAGLPLTSRMTCHWKVRVWTTAGAVWSTPASWTMGLLDSGDWTAQWIAPDPAAGNPEFPYLRKIFELAEAPASARVYVTSLGYHEVYINGVKVGDDVLSPAMTQLSDRALYLTHDVGPLLRKGTNCLAVHLGRGWYFKGHRDFAKVARTAGRPAVRLQLEAEDAGGGRVTVGTDGSWRGHPSPLSRTSLWGLRHDARLDLPGWAAADFDDQTWTPVNVCDVEVPELRAQMVEPNRIIRTIAPVRIEALENGAWRVDFGKNLVGWFRLRLRGTPEAGRTIGMQYGDHPGVVVDRDEYITAGRAGEQFSPRLSYQAFRYVTLTGLAEAPRPEDVEACFIRTDYAPAAAFACSNTRVSAIHDMVAYTLECLTLGGYMVDCPHYERLGYGGDGQASTESALMMHALGPLYRNWLAVWRDAQGADGDLPHTAPLEWAGGGPYWPGIIIAAPWELYVQYGDRRALEENYAAMQAWLGYVERHVGPDGLKNPWPNTDIRNWYLGDWAVPYGVDQTNPASVRLVVNCYRIHCYERMAGIAGVLARPDDAARYRAQAEALRPAVHRALYDETTKTYATGGQLELAFPLFTGVVPETLRADILRQLEQDIVVKRGGHVGVGLVGLPILIKTLMDVDRDDLVFGMVDKDTHPGWGHMLKNGGTTTWEHWNGDRSHIHNCYNSIGMWFYQSLAGIRPDPEAPGFARFVVKPVVTGDLTWVRAGLDTVQGRIESAWRLEGDRLILEIAVPPNTTATVHVPLVRGGRGGDAAPAAADVTESGRPADRARGVKLLRREPGAAVYAVESGRYRFEAKSDGFGAF